MKKLNLPYFYIRQALKFKALDSLVYYVWIRSRFNRPVIYNYTLQKVADVLDISVSATRKHVQVMIEMGWAEKRDGHFLLKSINKLNCKIISINVFTEKAKMKTTLRCSVIHHNIILQDEKIKAKSDLLTKARQRHGKIERKTIKFFASVGGVEGFAKTINSRTTLSNRKIGQMLRISRRTASKVQVESNKLGILKSEQFYVRIDSPTRLFEGGSGVFRNSRALVQRVANTILIPIPVHANQ